MQVTISGNKKTPSKTFKQGILYVGRRQTQGWLEDPADVFFFLEEVIPEENRMVIYDVFRKKRMKLSTKQHSMITKYAKVFDAPAMQEMIRVIFEMKNWWVRYGLAKNDIRI